MLLNIRRRQTRGKLRLSACRASGCSTMFVSCRWQLMEAQQLVGQSQGAMEKGVKIDEGLKRGAEEGCSLYPCSCNTPRYAVILPSRGPDLQAHTGTANC